MDHLDYGLSEPKLALMQDGSVFVAGQVQAPMEPPTQQSQSAGLRMMAAADQAGTTLTTGSGLFGVIASRTPIQILQVYPELFAKVKTDPAGKHTQFTGDNTNRYAYRSIAGAQSSTPTNSGKFVSTVSIPKGDSQGLTSDIAPGGDIQDYKSTNNYGRYYIVKVRRAPYSFTDDWTGFKMAIQMSVGGVQKDISPSGGYLIDPRPSPLPNPIVPVDVHNAGNTFNNLGGSTQPEFFEIDTHDETMTINGTQIKTGYLISYYKVLVTFHGGQASPYTWDETAYQEPPGYFCDYSFKISGYRTFDPLSSPSKLYSSDSSGQPGLLQTRQVALWPMPRQVWSAFGRRGTRVPVGGDFWVSLSTYKMLNVEAGLSTTNRKPWLQALKDAVSSGIINDVTYEHGGGHTGEHFSGNEIDMPPPNGTTFHLGNGAADWDAVGKFMFELITDADVDHFIFTDTVDARASFFAQLPTTWQNQIQQAFGGGNGWQNKWRVNPYHTDHIHVSFADIQSKALGL